MPSSFKCNTNNASLQAWQATTAPHRSPQICQGRMMGKVDENTWGMLRPNKESGRSFRSRETEIGFANQGETHIGVRKVEQRQRRRRKWARAGSQRRPRLNRPANWWPELPVCHSVQIYLPVRNPLQGPGAWAGGGRWGWVLWAVTGGPDPVKWRVVTWWCGDMWGLEDGWPGGWGSPRCGWSS